MLLSGFGTANMRLSAPTILIAATLVNLVPAGLGLAQSLIRSCEESERMTSIPADWRYRSPRYPDSIDAQLAAANPGSPK
jgi:hypothetical protein